MPGVGQKGVPCVRKVLKAGDMLACCVGELTSSIIQCGLAAMFVACTYERRSLELSLLQENWSFAASAHGRQP